MFVHRPNARRSTARRPSARTQHGLTLLDLLIALTILGIVFGIALPALDHAVARVRAAEARSALTATLFDAQRHATVLGREVVVCPAEVEQCIGGRDWSRGWISFVDSDGDRLRGPGETLIRREPALAPGQRLLGSVGRPRVVYQPNGGNAGTNIRWTLCDRRGADAAQALILSNGARLRHDRPGPAAAATCANGL
jgi:type IV fimbrial biogenesis protein FimT